MVKNIYNQTKGNHFCMVFEILGVNLLEIIKRYNYKGIPMHLARIVAK
jgi:serine/threonine-protein kinase SRPK3